MNIYGITASTITRCVPSILNARSTHTPIGLPAQGIDAATGQPVGDYVVYIIFICCTYIDLSLETWGGGSDSYFEYLIKYPRLFSDADDSFVDNWRLAVDSSIKTLLRVRLQRTPLEDT